MADRVPIPLTAVLIDLDSPEFAAISGWPFDDPFVARLLQSDIPQRVRLGNCNVWVYRDPDGRLAGFGTLDVCRDYQDLTGGRPHPYIPLLAINPTIPSRGYGTTIVQHLIDEAVLLACRPDADCADVLVLDVYLSSDRAIALYTRMGFVQVTPEPLIDPLEGGKPYIVMARRVAIAQG